MGDVAMPRLSDSMEEGTILKWLKSDGDDVSKGEELVEIETDKANMTYEADEAGTLEIVAQEGDTLAVGETICRLGEGGGSSDEDEQPEAEEEADEQGDEGAADEASEEEEEDEEPEPEAEEDEAEDEGEDEPEEPEAEEPEPGEDDGRVKASPIARRIAQEQGIDLSTIEGSGPGGRIVKADVEQTEAQPEPEAEPQAEEEAPKKRPSDQ